MSRHPGLCWIVVSLLALAGCESTTPVDTTPASDAAGGSDAADARADGAPACPSSEVLTPAPADPSCAPASAGDYTPGAIDGWAACVSDDGAYHPFSASVSSIARVDAFERIATKLGFGTDYAPTSADFIEAKAIFAEDQGLGSRLERREDEHYPPAPASCNTLTADALALYPDRCVGPAVLLPIVNAGFADGVAGRQPRENAARLEAAFLWFFYLSPFKEARTCASAVGDCDSAWAYYTGGEPQAGGKGFSRYVRAREPQAHAAIWNGLLAVRCWRDLDNPIGAATDFALRDRAVAQLDRGLARGLAAIVRQRVAARACSPTWPGTQLLGRALDRDATARDATQASAIRAELAKSDPSGVDEVKVLAALDALYHCGG